MAKEHIIIQFDDSHLKKVLRDLKSMIVVLKKIKRAANRKRRLIR